MYRLASCGSAGTVTATAVTTSSTTATTPTSSSCHTKSTKISKEEFHSDQRLAICNVFTKLWSKPKFSESRSTPRIHPASCTVGTGCLSRGLRGVSLTIHLI